MAHILGLKALAEGVEQQAQLDYLQQQGCDYYQGYLCSKPLSAQDFEQLLRGATINSSAH
jgi:EAL domain-containing protein (putative c-di-GMP-specific phosphodiesterase class I)